MKRFGCCFSMLPTASSSPFSGRKSFNAIKLLGKVIELRKNSS